MYETQYVPEMESGAFSLTELKYGIAKIKKSRLKTDKIHVHKYLEVFFNVNSKAVFFVNNALYPTHPGEAVVSRPNDLHVCHFSGDRTQEYYCLWIEVRESGTGLISFFDGADFSPHFSFESDVAAEMESLLSMLAEIYDRPGYELERTAGVLRGLFLLKGAKGNGGVPLPPTMRDILKHINENFSEIESIGALADEHFVSTATLDRWFRQFVGTSPGKYLESKKLTYAAQMLDGGASVTDACTLSGFSDTSHFIVLFKKKFGLTPLKYKKRR